MRKLLALCVGINDYEGSGSDLSGCVNDALGWSHLLYQRGYTPTTLLDGDATRANVTDALVSAMARLRFGDRFVFTYSGHGSWVRDYDGDEADGRDECLVMHDWQNAGVLLDDDLFAIYQARRYGVRVTAISDSCHSGTVARFAPTQARPRFFPPELLAPERRAPRPRSLRPDTVLLSGCADLEVSWDAWIDGRPQGAFSAAALATFSPELTMRDWHRRILGAIEYDQTPQLQATAWQRRWSL